MASFYCRLESNGDVYVRGDNWTYDAQGNEEDHIHSQWTKPKGAPFFNLTYEKFRSYFETACVITTNNDGKITHINDQEVS